MIDESEYDDILVWVAHPWHESWGPLRGWIHTGPGLRPFVRITGAKRASTGEPVPLSEVPMEYHNCRRGRELQRQGLLPAPWGPPPDEPERRDLADLPPEPAHLARDCDHD